MSLLRSTPPSRAWLSAVLLLAASPAAAQPGFDPDALTPAMASQRAVDTSPELAALRAQAESAHLGADGAIIGLVPRLTLSAGYRRLSPITNPPFGGPPLDPNDPTVASDLSGVDDPEAAALFDRLTRGNADEAAFPVFLNNYEVRARLDYSITAAVLRELPRRRAAALQAEVADVTIEDGARQVALAAQRVYFAAASARAADEVARESLRRAQSDLALVRARLEGGDATPAEGLSAESAVAIAEAEVARSETEVAVTNAQLAQALHVDDAAALTLALPPVVDAASLPAAEALLPGALAQRPELRVLRATEAAQEETRQSTRSGQLPDLSVYGDIVSANPNQRIFPPSQRFTTTWEIGVTLAWSPNDLLTSGTAVDQASAQLAATQASLRQAEEAVALELRVARARLLATEREIARRQAALGAAEASQRLRVAELEAGATTAAEVLRASVAVDEARIALRRAEIDARALAAELDFAAATQTWSPAEASR
ncbi:MAG: TolC family protein [Myxococcota bacterium]